MRCRGHKVYFCYIFSLSGFLNSLCEILTDKISVDVYAVQALCIATDSIINLRYPDFFEEGTLATHTILNHTFRPITEPKYESTLLYAKASHPDEFINQILDAKTEAKAVIQFQANHFTFLANKEKYHQPIIGAVSPNVSEPTGTAVIR